MTKRLIERTGVVALQLYVRAILRHPRLVVLALLAALALFGWLASGFRLDASADTLVLEHDEDLRYLQHISRRYGIAEFLLVAYTPRSGDLLSNETLADLASLADTLARMPRIDTVVSILDVPLLSNPPGPLKDLAKRLKTLRAPDVDRKLAADEIRESPLYRDLLVSRDMKSTALLVNFVTDRADQDLLLRRNELRDKDRAGSLTDAERVELEKVVERYREYQDRLKRDRHDDITAVRALLAQHADRARIYLGGVPMIADDMISFIRNDLKVFGVAMLAFLVLTLYVIFRRARWVMLSMACCLFSVVCMVGLLGAFDWQVTVISSNFISLQLVVTMALTIHLIERYTELQAERPDATNAELMRDTVRTIVTPCIYTTTTTIAGFASLVVCDILPVVNFGWMMAVGLIVSFASTFLLFPAAAVLLPRPVKPPQRHDHIRVTQIFARFTERHPAVIFVTAAVVVLATGVGIARLKVENSFIDYFRSSTEIYKGMRYIDKNLGGTTPLELIVRFPEAPPAVPQSSPPKPKPADDLFSEFQEFDDAGTEEKYWFTPDRIDTIARVHDYMESLPAIGKVLSIETMVKVVTPLLDGHRPDTFDMALLFSQIPPEMKRIIVDPYVSPSNNEARISVRVKDSLKGLQRGKLLEQVNADVVGRLGLKPDQVRLGGVMVLYNNMLRSLFRSQIQTIGLTVVALLAMFLALFRSVKLAVIALFPNLAASLVVLGVMGLLGIPLDMMTITIVAISIGIAVDNTIHYIHRFKREFPHDRRYLDTMYRCHGSIGNAMYYTSITIIVGFSILVFSNFIPSVLFGLLTGLAMIVALMAALTLLPRMIMLFKPFGPETDARN